MAPIKLHNIIQIPNNVNYAPRTGISIMRNKPPFRPNTKNISHNNVGLT